jgi:hypothetical protein
MALVCGPVSVPPPREYCGFSQKVTLITPFKDTSAYEISWFHVDNYILIIIINSCFYLLFQGIYTGAQGNIMCPLP